MPAVRKPKPQLVKKQATPTKKTETKKAVVSGQLKKRMPKEKPQPKKRPERGVVFVKHLPHGFFEHQLRQYFKQFGQVTRVRLARSERTGGSKGYAFVEFEYPEVAKVAADTMDNYLMFQKVVKASYIPPEQQKYNYFRTSVKKVTNDAGKDIYVSDVTKATQRSVKKQNNWSDSNCQKRTVAGIKKVKQLQEKYKHLGIEFSNLLVEPVKKSKEADSEEASTSAVKGKKGQKPKKQELKLEDLLGTTINEDSDDEDYIDESDDDSQQQQLTSDEDDAEVDSEEEEEEKKPLPKIAAKKTQKKNTAAERMSDLLKRKPGTGGIQKKKLAPSAKVNKKAATQSLQLAAAKKIAKPLQKQKVGKKLKK